MLFLSVLSGRSQSHDEQSTREFKLFGGLSFPAGDFGVSTSPQAGLAETGFTLGAEVCSEVARHFPIGVGGVFNIHGVDVSQFEQQFPGFRFDAGSWSLFWFTGLVGANTPVSPTVNLYAHGNLGLLLANSPDITVFSGGGSGHVSSATGTAFGYGFSFGALIDTRFDAGMRYLTGEPEFTVSSITGKQSISVFQLTFGYVFH